MYDQWEHACYSADYIMKHCKVLPISTKISFNEETLPEWYNNDNYIDENEIEVLTMKEANAIINNQTEPEYSDYESSDSDVSEAEYYDYFEYD